MGKKIGTLVELFDRRSLPNVVGVQAFSPEKVVYIADRKGCSKRKRENTEKFFEVMGMETKTYWHLVDMSDFNAVYSELKVLVEDFGAEVIDVTGGRAYSYIAAGLVCKEKEVNAVYYDFKKNEYREVFSGREIAGKAIKLSIPELIALSGGKVKANRHFSPEDDDDIMRDIIRVISEEYLKNKDGWNKFVTYMQRSARYGGEPSPLQLTFESPLTITKNGVKYRCVQGIMNHLADVGAFEEYFIEEETSTLHYSYASNKIKRLLTAYGDWLEMYTFMSAKDTGYFEDMQISVEIDWNGEIGEYGDVYNEIDGVYLKGVRALFVSNKLSGDLRTEDLYEISIQAERFGDGLAVPVIVTAEKVPPKSSVAYNRAKELGVEIISCSDKKKGTVGEQLKNILERE